MYGNDMNAVRSRYDYYYSVSSPSLSQAVNYYENSLSLFGEPIAPLLPPPTQRSPSPNRIPTPLTPFNTHNPSTSSSSVTNYGGVGSTPLIENFDNHLYESIRRDLIDRQNITNNNNNNNHVSNSLSKHQMWNQQSSSSSNTPPENEDFDSKRKRASSAFGNHNFQSQEDVSQNKYRALSANSGSLR